MAQDKWGWREDSDTTPRWNRWQKAQVIASFLIPVAIAAATGYLDYRNRQQAAVEANQQAQLAQEADDQQAELARLALIPQFMDALTGDDEKKRRLAIKTITTALPQEGPSILAALQESDQPLPEGDSELIQQVIDDAPRIAVEPLYSRDKTTRRRAYRALLASTLDAALIVDALIARGTSEPSNEDGVFNSLLYMSVAAPEVLKARETAVRAFSALVKGNGPQTAALVEEVLARIPA